MKGKKPNKQNYTENITDIDAKYQEFIKTTKDKDTFIIQNVAEDNACFFRSVSNGLYHITEADGDSGIQVLYSIGNWKKEIDGHKTIKNKFWGYKGSEQTYLATKVQQIAKKWLIQNQYEYVNNIPGYRVVDLVKDSHGFDFNDDEVVMAVYDICYSKFAGLPRIKKNIFHNNAISSDELNSDNDNMECIENDDNMEYIEDDDNKVFNYCAIDDDDNDNTVYEDSEKPCIIEDELIKEQQQLIMQQEDIVGTQTELPIQYNSISQENEVTEEDNTTSFMEDQSNTDDQIEQDMGFRIDIDEKHIKLKEKFQKYNISDMWDRWGSSAEAYALSKYFQVPIIIYAPKRFNFKTGKTENGRMYKDVKPDKNVRFQVLQIWGDEFIDKSPPIELLYRKIRKNIEHYMVLYRA
jgi:hypothetical protein